MIALYIFLILLGLVIIFKGGDLLVNSSLKLCKLLGLSPLFVGVVLVSLLTTIPEIIITFLSIGKGFTGLAVGDAVGTIIFNTAVILGVGLTFGGLYKLSKKYLPKLIFLLLATLLVGVFAISGVIYWYQGIILVLIYIGFTWYNLKEAKKEAAKEQQKQQELIDARAYKETIEELSTEITRGESVENATRVESRDLKKSSVKTFKRVIGDEKDTIDFSNNYKTLKKSIDKHEKIVDEQFNENIKEIKEKRAKENLKTILMFLFSGALVALGAYLLVEFGQKFAYALNISEDIVGLLILGVGSSLPELATCIGAIKNKTVELSVGNIIGANIINLCLLIGGGAIVAAKVGGLPIAFETLVVSIPVMVLSVLVVCFSLICRKNIAKKQGKVLLALYSTYFIFSLLNIFIKIV